MTKFHSYVWTEAETRETNERGLQFRLSWDYLGRVREYYLPGNEKWVMKSIDSDSFEVTMQKFLYSDKSPENHTLPGEIIDCGSTHLLFMPYCAIITLVCWESLDEMVDAMEQYFTGLRHMHQLGVAHLDIHSSNLVYSTRTTREWDAIPSIQEGRAFFIDFGLSKRFPPPSGHTNGSITVSFDEGCGHFPPPEGMEAVNPYAYDIFCMGWMMDTICRAATNASRWSTRIRVPLSVWALSAVLRAQDPQTRPSAAHALDLVKILKIWVKMTRWLYWFIPYHQADIMELRGWKIVYHCIHSKKASHGTTLGL